MTIFAGVGGPQANASASGGKVYGYNNISEVAAIVVAPANAQRQKITFHNPGSNDFYVAPVNVQNVLGTVPAQPSDHPLTLLNGALGGSRIVYGNGGTLEITGECQGAWQAIAKTGAGGGNPLTVTDSNT